VRRVNRIAACEPLSAEVAENSKAELRGLAISSVFLFAHQEFDQGLAVRWTCLQIDREVGVGLSA